MLPGFRFLFAAIVLSMSVLVFGLGAAALLRAAHEKFASNSSWHAPPERRFAQPAAAPSPVLTMLRVDPLAAEQNGSDDLPAVAAPLQPAEITSAPAETEKTAALESEDSSPPDRAKPEAPVSESPVQSEAAPVQADQAASADTPASGAAHVSDHETKVAASEQLSSPTQVLSPADQAAPTASEPGPTASEAAPATSEQAHAPVSSEPDPASTKIAAPGGPPVVVETQPPTKTASIEAAHAQGADAKPDSSATKKRLQAQAAQRRRIALRARAARQASQQPADPFALPLVQPAAAARSR
jgi:hypothetical protein